MEHWPLNGLTQWLDYFFLQTTKINASGKRKLSWNDGYQNIIPKRQKKSVFIWYINFTKYFMLLWQIFETLDVRNVTLHLSVESRIINFPVGIYMFKVNKRNARTRCEICSKLTIKTYFTYLNIFHTLF